MANQRNILDLNTMNKLIDDLAEADKANPFLGQLYDTHNEPKPLPESEASDNVTIEKRKESKDD